MLSLVNHCAANALWISQKIPTPFLIIIWSPQAQEQSMWFWHMFYYRLLYSYCQHQIMPNRRGGSRESQCSRSIWHHRLLHHREENSVVDSYCSGLWFLRCLWLWLWPVAEHTILTNGLCLCLAIVIYNHKRTKTIWSEKEMGQSQSKSKSKSKYNERRPKPIFFLFWYLQNCISQILVIVNRCVCSILSISCS